MNILSDLINDYTLRTVALGAAVFVLRQVLSTFRPDEAGAACDHCEPGAPAGRDAPR